MKEDELKELMVEVVTKVVQPHTEAVREVLDMYARLDERLNFAERVARLETQVEQLGQLEERVRDLERRMG